MAHGMNAQSRVLEAIAALQRGDRAAALALLQDELRHGPPDGERWRSISQLAQNVGEIDVCIEAARRYSRTQPMTVDRLLHYWGELTAHGRHEIALAEAEQLPPAAQSINGVLHFLGTVAVQEGRFDQAEGYFRKALSQPPEAAHTWFALSMMKTFTSADDPDIAAMERLLPRLPDSDPLTKSRFLYGLAKAWHDVKEPDRAMAHYARGATLRRAASPFDFPAMERLADDLIRNHTAENLSRLTPPRVRGNRAIFVNGLPRSGTTLVEQILTSHSAVSDGAEINLVKAALLAAGDMTMGAALAVQQRAGAGGDPWGEANGHYHRMLGMRFGHEGRVVDKTLLQSHFMGLLLHMLPEARIIWMRRSAEDVALSCYRTYFTAPVNWSWSFADIGRMMRIEDRLYAHWAALYPERILTVPYEELASDPAIWIPKILDHAGLAMEPQVLEPHKTKRSVRTASVAQVRAPISAKSVGYSGAYADHMTAFRDAYYG